MANLVDGDPYPWPYHGVLDPFRCALVVAGAQPAWAERSRRASAVLAVIDAVAGPLRRAGGCVVAIQHRAHPAGRRSSLPPPAGDPCGGLLAGLPPCDLVVAAQGTSGFHASPLDLELRARHLDHLILCGFGAEATLDSTLRAANDRGYECLTLVDGAAPFDDGTGRRALSSITMSGGIFGAVAPSAALLTALSGLIPSGLIRSDPRASDPDHQGVRA